MSALDLARGMRGVRASSRMMLDPLAWNWQADVFEPIVSRAWETAMSAGQAAAAKWTRLEFVAPTPLGSPLLTDTISFSTVLRDSGGTFHLWASNYVDDTLEHATSADGVTWSALADVGFPDVSGPHVISSEGTPVESVCDWIASFDEVNTVVVALGTDATTWGDTTLIADHASDTQNCISYHPSADHWTLSCRAKHAYFSDATFADGGVRRGAIAYSNVLEAGWSKAVINFSTDEEDNAANGHHFVYSVVPYVHPSGIVYGGLALYSAVTETIYTDPAFSLNWGRDWIRPANTRGVPMFDIGSAGTFNAGMVFGLPAPIRIEGDAPGFNDLDRYYAVAWDADHNQTTGRNVTLAAGGYTNCDLSDVGKTVVGGTTGDTGTLRHYENGTREWQIDPDTWADEFDVAEVLTITDGTGTGTTTGAATGRVASLTYSEGRAGGLYRRTCELGAVLTRLCMREGTWPAGCELVVNANILDTGGTLQAFVKSVDRQTTLLTSRIEQGLDANEWIVEWLPDATYPNGIVDLGGEDIRIDIDFGGTGATADSYVCEAAPSSTAVLPQSEITNGIWLTADDVVASGGNFSSLVDRISSAAITADTGTVAVTEESTTTRGSLDFAGAESLAFDTLATELAGATEFTLWIVETRTNGSDQYIFGCQDSGSLFTALRIDAAGDLRLYVSGSNRVDMPTGLASDETHVHRIEFSSSSVSHWSVDLVDRTGSLSVTGTIPAALPTLITGHLGALNSTPSGPMTGGLQALLLDVGTIDATRNNRIERRLNGTYRSQ